MALSWSQNLGKFNVHHQQDVKAEHGSNAIDLVILCFIVFTTLNSLATRIAVIRHLAFALLFSCVSALPTKGDGAAANSINVGPSNSYEHFLHSVLPIVLSGLCVGIIATLMTHKYGPSRVSGLMMATCAYVGITISEDAATTPALFWTYVAFP